MKNFRTSDDFVTTAGKNDRKIGSFCSVEYAEMRGEALRVGTEYTIWKIINGKWMAYRTRVSS